jgi:hypothetical protein
MSLELKIIDSKNNKKFLFFLLKKAKFLNDSTEYGLGYLKLNSEPYASTSITRKLFAGAVYDAYKMYVYAQVYDENDAFTVFSIDEPVKVLPVHNDVIVDRVKLTIESDKLDSETNLERIADIQRISSLLNLQSLEDKLGILDQSKNLQNKILFPHFYGPLSEYAGITPVFIK